MYPTESRATEPAPEAEQQQSFFQLLQIFKPFLAILSGDAGLQSVDELSAALIKTAAFELAVEYLKRDPAGAELIRERYIAPHHDLEALRRCPQDSLGFIYASHMAAQNFDPDLYSHLEIDSDASYVEARLGQTHDLWHVATGFDTSGIGEIGLQAFHLSQFPYPLATMLVANSLMSSTLLAPEDLPRLLDEIARGLEMGKVAKPLFAQKWEQAWDKPLADWQKELGLPPTHNR